MANFKQGDKVRVREGLIIGKCYWGGLVFSHEKYGWTGRILTIKNIDIDGHYSVEENDLLWCDSMLETAMFTKADLKDGMVVETKESILSEKYFLVLGDRFVGRRGGWYSSYYNDDLTRTDKKDGLDIIKVYKTNASFLNQIVNEEYLEVIWERPLEIEYIEMTIEEIEKVLGHKVKVIGSEDKT